MDKVVFVRHQEKKWDNKHKGEYRLDSPLTNRGLERWKEQILELESIHGLPTRIVSSPFYRCRQMLEELMKVYRNTPVEIDAECGEYLGHQKLSSIDNNLLRDDTLIYPVIYKEDIPGLKERAQRVYQKYTSLSGYTLVITHGFLMHQIAAYEDNLEGVCRKRSFQEGQSLEVIASNKNGN